MKLNILFLLVNTLLIPMISYAASFDCTKANTFVEKTICTDDKLSAMDEELNTLYNEVQLNNLYSEQRKKSQMAWLKELNKCNTKFSNEYAKSKCILASYEGRIRDLKKMKEHKEPTFELIDKISFQDYGGIYTTFNNKVIFTNYDSITRNNYQIIEVDPIDFKFNVLLTTEGESKYIAHNKTFIAYKRRGLADTEELIIKNRKTDKTIVKKRFSDRIIWGEIVGNDKVVVVQKTEIFIFDLKSLRTIKIHEFEMEMDSYVRHNKYRSYVLSVAKWKNKIVILTPSNLLVFDENLREVKTIILGGSNSNRRNLIISNDKAVVSFEKDVKIFDLDTEKELLSISKPGRFVSYTIMDNFLIVAPREAGNGVLNAQVYNLSTGKVQATVPLIAKAITYNNGVMLTCDYEHQTNGTFTLYKVDLNSIAGNNVITTQLQETYKQAQKAFKQTKDFYVSLEILDKAGIEKYLSDNNSILEEEKVIFRQYGIWLSQTLDKYDKTKYVFDNADIKTNDNEVKKALDLATVKECYLDSKCEVNERDIKKIVGVENIPNTKMYIDMSSINKAYFIDDKIFISRCEGGPLGTAIYDTNTLDHVKNICFDSSEDEQVTTTIVDTKKYVILNMRDRYNSREENFAVINKQDLSVKCQGNTQVNLENFSYENNEVCECLNGKVPCKNKKLKKDELTSIMKKASIKISRDEVAKDITNNYIITNTEWSEYKLHFYALNKDEIKEPKKVIRHTTLDVIPNSDKIVYSYSDINSKMNDRVKFGLYDIKKNIDKTLFYTKMKLNAKYPYSIVYKNLLIIGLGHDLFIYNFKKMKLVAYHTNFIKEKGSNHVDENQISSLSISSNKLFVVTFDGKNSRVVELNNLEKLQ